MKIQNNTTKYISLGMLVFLFAVAFFPSHADAQRNSPRGRNGTGTGAVGGYVTIERESNNPPVEEEEQIPVYSPAPTPTVYSASGNPDQVATASPTPKKTAKVAAPAAQEPAEEDNSESDLAANAIFGEDSFMPSSLIEWIFFAILVILAVIFVRKIYGGAEKYHATPLKHD